MITKTVIKDYVAKKCPYLAALELEDRKLIDLLKRSVDLQKQYKELISDAKEENDDFDQDDVFNLTEILKDYPHLKDEIIKYSKKVELNPAERLIEKYNDDQIVSTLSRTYFINK